MKTLFIKMRNSIGKTDNSLSYIMVIHTVKTIYSILLVIYALSAMSANKGNAIKIVNQMAYSTVSSVVELIATCFVCGLVHEKSDSIYGALDSLNSNTLSEFQFKEWVMFKTITRKNRFGFTIGGFASLRKTTLISV